MSRNAITVWKAASEGVHGPPCLECLSEHQWAVWICGGAKCQVCGAKGVLKMDFSIRHRVCTPCKKSNLFAASKFAKLYPNYVPVLMKLVPYTNVGGRAHGHTSGTKFF
ncbi:hypothetical protein Hypma_012172 [Hypsizygus marmoreus]|uniref:Uncharacterized protein n=1 Tax=Hypsizygus marmoreus TaxID=39966 RepID=A0A369JJM4_HYPMA|nr:hypothetical protein Hypma_012172 [Hypsizygus marmoreus]